MARKQAPSITGSPSRPFRRASLKGKYGQDRSPDVLDKIGDRHLGIKVPVPLDRDVREKTSNAVKEIVEGQGSARRDIAALLGSDMRMTRERATTRHGFSVRRDQITKRVLIPEFYDPTLASDLAAEEERTQARWITLGELVSQNVLGAETGVEVGKKAYGTGTIPFLRTTDIADLEVKGDPAKAYLRKLFRSMRREQQLKRGTFCSFGTEPTSWAPLRL